MSNLLVRLRSLFRRNTPENEMEEELRGHIKNRADDLEHSGLARAEAERRARVEFGGYQKFREEARAGSGKHFFETLIQDFRYGLRMLRKTPGFTAIAILTLALGTGANTAIFSVVYAALIRPLPYSEPDRLITLGEVRQQELTTNDLTSASWDASNPDFQDWKQQSKTFQSLAGFTGDGFTLRGGGEPRTVFAVQASTNMLSTLGVKPILGRDFADGEDIATGPNVAILTYGFWKSNFGGDANVVGRSIQLDTNSVNIIGVLPREFEFAPVGNAVLWVPFHLSKGYATRRNLRWMSVIGRLAPGVTQEGARTEMNAINARLIAAYPKENGATQIVFAPLRDRIIGQIQRLLLVLFGAAGFVLLIACANVANLLMVRAAGRRKEFAIRSALGASRGRLISQLLAESMILAVGGSAAGFLVAQWGTSALLAAIPESLLDALPFLRDAHANPAVLAFLGMAAILTGIAFGLAPALQTSSHEGVGKTLNEEARAVAGGVRTRVRNVLVVVEIAFSLVLLVGAGLMVKSLTALLRRDPGFSAQNLLTFSVFLPPASYPKDPDAIRFDRQFTDRVRALPGIAGVTSNSVLPLSGGGNTIRFLVEGQTMETGQEYECAIRDISPNYFSVMKIPMVAGRTFDDSTDSPTSPEHIIVNRAWVKQYLHGENPIGKRMKFTYSPTQGYREIVGVASNVVDAGLDTLNDEPAVFLPFAQDANSFISYIARTNGSPAAAIGGIRSALRATDSQLILIQPKTMDEIIAQSPSVFLRRYPSFLIGSFAALALVLATVGLYGVISYSASQRTREIGIRVALGAQRSDVLRLILGKGASLALTGVAIGVVAAFALTRLMSSLLFGVGAADPVTFAGVAALITVVAIAASYIPARRAMRVDPMVALRNE